VAVGDFEAEFDADQSAREREETKRLMYVALTRARDRLYLAAATTEGAFKPRNGSLGEVLPESMRGLFASAAGADADGAEATWVSESGGAHTFRVCVPSPVPRPTSPRRSRRSRTRRSLFRRRGRRFRPPSPGAPTAGAARSRGPEQPVQTAERPPPPAG